MNHKDEYIKKVENEQIQFADEKKIKLDEKKSKHHKKSTHLTITFNKNDIDFLNSLMIYMISKRKRKVGYSNIISLLIKYCIEFEDEIKENI